MKKILLAFTLLASMFTVAAADTKKPDKPADKAPADKPLYDRLGGEKAIKAVVHDFVGNCAADKRINKRFAKTDIPKLEQSLVDQICEATGGPCKYTGKSMPEAHKGMNITDAQFDALVEDLKKTLDKLKVGAEEQKELLGALAPMRADIVGK
jgi:hemoglobin